LSANARSPQERRLLARALRPPLEAFIDMSHRQLLAARISVSSLALTCAMAAWALAAELLSRM